MTDLPERGRLKVFLGYAAGVGKTYQMLTEAHDMKGRGVDVVVGYFEPHGRRETIALAEGLEDFFKESTLVALRELAMRQAAYSVESRLPSLELDQPTATSIGVAAVSQDRLLLVLTPHPSSAALIRRGRRAADYLRAECLAPYVAKDATFSDLTTEERESLDRHLNFARGLQIETRIVQGKDVAEEIVSFARLHAVTQVFVPREPPSAIRSWFASAFVQRIVNLAKDMQVTVVADRSRRQS
jgi:two-component system sensor histidine kinase KdpD